MNLPSWMQFTIVIHECAKCHHDLDERSLLGVGVMLVEQGEDVPPTPRAQVMVHCKHCGHRAGRQVEIGLAEMQEAVRLVHDYGPKIVHPPHGQMEAASDRGVQALGPLDELARRTLRDQLKRMSFNRSTKSFKRWIAEVDDEHLS